MPAKAPPSKPRGRSLRAPCAVGTHSHRPNLGHNGTKRSGTSRVQSSSARGYVGCPEAQEAQYNPTQAAIVKEPTTPELPKPECMASGLTEQVSSLKTQLNEFLERGGRMLTDAQPSCNFPALGHEGVPQDKTLGLLAESTDPESTSVPISPSLAHEALLEEIAKAKQSAAALESQVQRLHEQVPDQIVTGADEADQSYSLERISMPTPTGSFSYAPENGGMSWAGMDVSYSQFFQKPRSSNGNLESRVSSLENETASLNVQMKRWRSRERLARTRCKDLQERLQQVQHPKNVGAAGSTTSKDVACSPQQQNASPTKSLEEASNRARIGAVATPNRIGRVCQWPDPVHNSSPAELHNSDKNNSPLKNIPRQNAGSTPVKEVVNVLERSPNKQNKSRERSLLGKSQESPGNAGGNSPPSSAGNSPPLCTMVENALHRVEQLQKDVNHAMAVVEDVEDHPSVVVDEPSQAPSSPTILNGYACPSADSSRLTCGSTTQFPQDARGCPLLGATAIREGLDGIVAQMQEHDRALRSLQEAVFKVQEHQRSDGSIPPLHKARARTMSPRTLSPTPCPSELNMPMALGDPLLLTPRSGPVHLRLTSVASSIGHGSTRLPSPSRPFFQMPSPGTPGWSMTPHSTCPTPVPSQCLPASVSGSIISPRATPAVPPEVAIVRSCLQAPVGIVPPVPAACMSPHCVSACLSPRHTMPSSPRPRHALPASPRHTVPSNPVWRLGGHGGTSSWTKRKPWQQEDVQMNMPGTSYSGGYFWYTL